MIQLNCLPLRLAFDQKTLAVRLNEKKLVPSFVRTVGEMRPVMLSPHVATPDSRVCYWVYRHVERPVDKKAFKGYELEYDVTVLDHSFLGPERNKTLGHYHSTAPDGLAYPEVYEVLYGQAHFILQKRAAHGSREVVDVKVITADEGDRVVVEPGYGHVSINASHEPLVLANVQCTLNENDYSPYVEKHGAAYYEFGSEKFLPNPHYHKVPPLRLVQASSFKHVPKFGEGNLYANFLAGPRRYEFLRSPSRYWRA
ncbi:MAG: glucose-6-phosphate isomerase family protein [Candidatus Micrarchaeota archaeon]